jgi:hypothetical protein
VDRQGRHHAARRLHRQLAEGSRSPDLRQRRWSRNATDTATSSTPPTAAAFDGSPGLPMLGYLAGWPPGRVHRVGQPSRTGSATQAHPEFKSRPTKPAPLFRRVHCGRRRTGRLPVSATSRGVGSPHLATSRTGPFSQHPRCLSERPHRLCPMAEATICVDRRCERTRRERYIGYLRESGRAPSSPEAGAGRRSQPSPLLGRGTRGSA